MKPKIYFQYTTKRGSTRYIKNATTQRITRELASISKKNMILRGRLKVVYGLDQENEIVSDKISDLKWALNAFLEE